MNDQTSWKGLEKMAKSPPSFDFYPNDFIGGTYTMTAEEVGVYIRLLMQQWQNGLIPRDRRKLERICNVSAEEFERIWAQISCKFLEVDDGFINERMDVDRNKALLNWKRNRETSKKRSSAGKTGMESRWKGKSEKSDNKCYNKTITKDNKWEEGRWKLEEGSFFEEKKEGGTGEEKKETLLDFERFWTAFPAGRKSGKGKAREAWTKAISKADPETIIASADEYAKSNLGGGEFVMKPTTWLNGECWDDERTAWNVGATGKPVKTIDDWAFLRTPKTND